MPNLEVNHLVKQIKNRTIVNDVSLTINCGEIVGLLGPNGAGKTTCFYMIVGLVPCSSGHIIWNNQPITQLPIHQRARLGLGYLPQEASIFRKLSVEDNILAVLQLQKKLTTAQQKEKLEHLLDEFHIQHIRKNLGISLSGGERRRVEIARALATEPQLILLDEPFAGIDPKSINEVKNIIYHLQKKGIGILITDHNVRETLDICQRAYILNHGQVLCEGDPKTILINEKVRDVYLGEHFEL
ncbi:MAG: LPS export ABC transporter ATP-binding protein [Gammaproteobacteria bacterium]